MGIVTIDPAKKEVIDRAKAQAALDAWFAGKLAEGFVTPDGFTLGLEVNDVSLLTGNYVLSKEAASLGYPIPPIVDVAGLPHAIADIDDLTGIMLAYGQHRASLSAQYAISKAGLEG